MYEYWGNFSYCVIHSPYTHGLVHIHKLHVDSQIPQILSPVSCSCLDYVLWTILNMHLLIMAIIVSRYQQLRWCIICDPQLVTLCIWCQRIFVPWTFSITVWKFHFDGLFWYQAKYFCVAVYCVVLARMKTLNKLLKCQIPRLKYVCFSKVCGESVQGCDRGPHLGVVWPDRTLQEL